MLAVPVGTVGLVVSNLSTASTLEGVRIDDLARDRTAPQIFDLNRQALRNMDIEYEVIEKLLVNRNYTPIDMAVIVASLEAMPGVQDKDAYLIRLAQVDNRVLAYFMRRTTEMIRNHQVRGAGFTRFEMLSGYPFLATRSGRIVGAMPFDAVSWTQTTAKTMRNSAAVAGRTGPARPIELRITGTATAMAKQELQKLGIQVVENAKF
jgi:hypothetical protein